MHRVYFSNLILDPTIRTLSSVEGESIQLRPLPYAVLSLLLENQGAHVTRECLFETCWEGALVTDQAITNVISGLRKSFAQLGATDVTIRTVSKIGYVLEIHCAEEPVKKKVEERTIRVSQESEVILATSNNGDEPIKVSAHSKHKENLYLWHAVVTVLLFACLIFVLLAKPFIRKPDFIQPSEYQHFQVGATDFYLHDSTYLISDGQLLAYELATQSFPTCHADVYLRVAESAYDDGVYLIKAFAFAKHGSKNASYVNHSVTIEQIPETVVKAIKRAKAICA
ncbi:winged helix-turn-helix domain-containing protein [Vibrio gigantis]|uniref:transcriptional regulator n=1 Tax=Vibrio gigantis TaxID=296199 RepID=UPI001EFBF8B8|nr:winged helix-turn-helix domain-containing protein [Vibrio gigantis]ULN64405.1 winged helix-turn-helix domain-containing protein [Vibrio gigantis]